MITAETASLFIDGLLLLLFLLYAVEGYRRGFLRTLVGTIGFVVGALLAFRFAPGIIERIDPDLGPLASLGILFGLVLFSAVVVQGLVVALARAVLPARENGPGPLDRVLGMLTTTALAVVVAWLAGGLLRVAMPGDVARVVDDSRVLAAIEDTAPVPQSRVLDDAAQLFDRYEFPRVFEGTDDEPITPVEEADPAVADNEAIMAAGRSVVRIDATAPACGRMQEGTGFVVDDDLVVTNAHVITGSDRVVVRKDRLRSTAEVVAFDAARDLAVLHVDVGDLAPLTVAADDLDGGSDAVVAGYPLGGPYRVDAARIRDTLTARGRDIYGEDVVTRAIYALRAPIEPGNSGGPLLTTTGEVAGVIFARSYSDEDTAYALRLDELRPVLDAAQPRQEVAVGGCAEA